MWYGVVWCGAGRSMGQGKDGRVASTSGATLAGTTCKAGKRQSVGWPVQLGIDDATM